MRWVTLSFHSNNIGKLPTPLTLSPVFKEDEQDEVDERMNRSHPCHRQRRSPGQGI